MSQTTTSPLLMQTGLVDSITNIAWLRLVSGWWRTLASSISWKSPSEVEREGEHDSLY